MSAKEFNPIYSVHLVNYLTWKRAVVRRFQAKMFVISIEANNKRYKVLQIIFRKNGCLYIGFPYFDNNQGILSIGYLSELSPTTNVKLETLGKVTTNQVKYVHHSSGDVHFSQTGKIKTMIEKKSLPLIETEGHIFSFHIQGLEHFEESIMDETPTLERTILNFKFDEIPESAKIVGRWYKTKGFMNRTKGSSFGPIVQTQTPEGKRSEAFLLGTPEGWDLEDHVLSLNCEEIPLMSSDKNASMLFIGGFGKVRNSILYEKESFLCASYPVLNFEQVENRIGSLDIIRSL